MPKINDASQLTLTGLVHQLRVNRSSQNASKELRSAGKAGLDLYVKDGQKMFESTNSLTRHRAEGVQLVRDSLKKEFSCTTDDAEKIMKNVFGDVPAQMTDDMLCDLYEIASAARATVAALPPGLGPDLHTAFASAVTRRSNRANDMARLTEDFKARGLPEQEAYEAASLVRTRYFSTEQNELAGVRLGQEVIAGKASLLDAKNALGNQLEVRNAFLMTVMNAARGLPPYEKSSEDEKAKWRNVIAVLGASEPLSIDDFRTLPIADKALLRHALSRMPAQLPTYEKSSAPEKTAWLNIANALRRHEFVPIDDVKKLSVGHKASLLRALSADVNEQIEKKNVPRTSAAYLSVAWFNQTITLGDVVSSDDMDKMESYLKKCSKDPILQAAKDNWPNMRDMEREAAISRMIELHAKEFGYSVPTGYLKVYQFPDTGVGTSVPDGRLGVNMMINSGSENFKNFNRIFNTVCHESTHKYQWRRIDKSYEGMLAPLRADYDRARLMEANMSATINDASLVADYNWAPDLAYTAYRQSPVEQHAFYLGDFAMNRIKRLYQ